MGRGHIYSTWCSCSKCTKRTARAEQEYNERQQQTNPHTSTDFGNGEVGGDNRWTAPVHGNTEDGEDVTVSFGKSNRDGHTGISSGHVSGSGYYSKGGHDHYGREGESHRDSGRYDG